MVNPPRSLTAPPGTGFRWRIIPAALLMIVGFLQVVLSLVMFLLLLFERFFATTPLLRGAFTPEPSTSCLVGMGLMVVLGIAWVLAGRLIWRGRFLIGLLFALAAYPLGVYGASLVYRLPQSDGSTETTGRPQP